MSVRTYTVNAILASNNTIHHLNVSLQFLGSSGSSGSKSRMTSSCFVSSSVICRSKGCSSSGIVMVIEHYVESSGRIYILNTMVRASRYIRPAGELFFDSYAHLYHRWTSGALLSTPYMVLARRRLRRIRQVWHAFPHIDLLLLLC
jgi:hypothetical protein